MITGTGCDRRWVQRQGREGQAALDADALPYALRHTFAAFAIADGMQTFELAQWMGTSVLMIDKTYGHLLPGSAQAAWERMDAFDARAYGQLSDTQEEQR